MGQLKHVYRGTVYNQIPEQIQQNNSDLLKTPSIWPIAMLVMNVFHTIHINSISEIIMITMHFP